MEKTPEVKTCNLKFAKITEDLTGSQKKNIFKVTGMDFKNQDCIVELEKFGKEQADAIGGAAVMVNFTTKNIKSYNFKNYKSSNVDKIFARYKRLPVGEGFEKDPYGTSYF